MLCLLLRFLATLPRCTRNLSPVGFTLFAEYQKRAFPKIDNASIDAKWLDAQNNPSMKYKGKEFWDKLHATMKRQHSSLFHESASSSAASSSALSTFVGGTGGGGELTSGGKIKTLTKAEFQAYVATIGRAITESNVAVAKMLSDAASM